MLKFKFNHQQNTLVYQKEFDPETWYQIPEDQQFTGNFGSSGFNLEEGLINFTVYERRIRVFYKQIKNGVDLTDFWEPQQIAYFRKDLPKECPLIFTFSDQDEVEKINDKWVKKGGNHAH